LALPFQYRSIEWHDGVPVLITERLMLRIPEDGDLDSLFDFHARNVEHFRPWFPSSALFPSRESLESALVARTESAHADTAYRFNVFPLSDPTRIIGLCSVSEVRRGAIQQAVMSYAIDHAEQGKGFVTEAVSASVKFAFDDLDLHRLEGSYMVANEKSGAVLERLGFQREAIFKEYLFLNDKWQDHIVTSLLNPNWRAEGRRTK
jgi:ribosomal-protein-alanine N-acetyltransferase